MDINSSMSPIFTRMSAVPELDKINFLNGDIYSIRPLISLVEIKHSSPFVI